MPADATALLDEIRKLAPEEKKGLCKNVLGEFKGKEIYDFAGQFFKGLQPDALKDALVGAASNLPEKEKKEAVKETARQLSRAQQVSIGGEIQQGGVLAGPGEKTRDSLWLVVVSAFAFVLVGSFISIATAMFVAVPQGAVKPELVLTMFTSVVGFLAGLFVPSPAGNKQGQA
ncbi:hypothetical protein FBQ96_00945 [Nitrospirales bacterium NOB]|nr:hypothetical protein [Nitrospirota bacterium]MCE7964315.1 hypothetical protein [Nitrospira sp. NTP2]MCK6492607.1 hypothetical protein [Nitrospira sp.]MDL1888147.1 hypothetical protein [Nitrospirales bacterium NOB]MEB2337321.1 hypothetical protein [Nitrospirales bacterium]